SAPRRERARSRPAPRRRRRRPQAAGRSCAGSARRRVRSGTCTRRTALTGKASVPEVGRRVFALGVAACSVALGVLCLVRVDVRPPHEDETLALFVGRKSLPGLLHAVLFQRGGAPLPFLLAWLGAHPRGGLTALRLVSTVCAVAALPVVALLGARLVGRTVGLVAAALLVGSSIVLDQAVFGRMYALFLLTSALSYLALVA